MSATATRRHLDEIFAETDNDRQADRRTATRLATCTELRALISVALTDLRGTLGDVAELVDSRRPGVKVGGHAPKGATTPAPVNVSALSTLEEVSGYYDDVRHRLRLQLARTGISVLGTPRLEALLELIDDPARLRPIHRDLERLAEQAHRVVDGQRRLPDPCPHCRHRTLLVDHDTGITTCGKDPKTGRRLPCRCADRYCPCHHNPRYRHAWSRAERAHKPTSWQGLGRAQKEALVLEAAHDRIRTLHTKTPIQPWAVDCADHTHEREHLSAWDESICITCPPTGHVCAHCLDLAGGDALDTHSPATWPCATIRALDDLPAPTPARAADTDPEPSTGP